MGQGGAEHPAPAEWKSEESYAMKPGLPGSLDICQMLLLHNRATSTEPVIMGAEPHSQICTCIGLSAQNRQGRGYWAKYSSSLCFRNNWGRERGKGVGRVRPRPLRMLAGPFWEVLVTMEPRVCTPWSFAAEHTDPLSTARADTMNC